MREYDEWNVNAFRTVLCLIASFLLIQGIYYIMHEVTHQHEGRENHGLSDSGLILQYNQVYQYGDGNACPWLAVHVRSEAGSCHDCLRLYCNA